MSNKQTGTSTLVTEKFSQLTTNSQIMYPFFKITSFGVYPKIDLPHHSKHDNVFVYWYNGNGISEQMHFKVSILSESKDKLYTQEYNWEFDGTFSCTAVAFISRSKLLDHKNGYLVNDKLTLVCEAEIIDKKAIKLDLAQDLDNLSEDFQSLLIDEKFNDATLIVGSNEKKFHVHKNILSARSSVFAAMFEHDCEEKRQNEVKITDIDSETFDELLVYIYTGKVKQMDRYALDLLQAADKYQLESLKNICEDYLCSNLSIESASNVLFVADLHGATKLKNKCLDFISANVNQMKDTDGWKALESNAKLLCDLVFYMSNNKNK